MEPRKCVSGAGSTMRLSQWNAYYLSIFDLKSGIWNLRLLVSVSKITGVVFDTYFFLPVSIICELSLLSKFQSCYLLPFVCFGIQVLLITFKRWYAPVSDRVTQALMNGFYTMLKAGNTTLTVGNVTKHLTTHTSSELFFWWFVPIPCSLQAYSLSVVIPFPVNPGEVVVLLQDGIFHVKQLPC